MLSWDGGVVIVAGAGSVVGNATGRVMKLCAEWDCSSEAAAVAGLGMDLPATEG